MSSAQQAKSNILVTSATFLKQNEEFFKQQEVLFKSQSQKVGRHMENLSNFDKLLRTVKNFKRYYAKAVQKMEEEIQNAQDQIAEIRKEQRNQFHALSKEDQRRMCEVVGLGYLERTISAGEEVLPAVDALSVSDKPKEVLQDAVDLFQETDIRLEAPRGLKNISQLPDRRTKSSQDEGNTIQVQHERADRWRSVAEFIPMPHKRIEALRGTMVPLPKAYSNQAQHQQKLWSEDEAQCRTVAQVSLSSAACGADVEQMLRQNLERQRVLRQGLRRSKEDILQMQEDIKRGEERVDVEVEAFLKARDVDEMGQEDEKG